jgi:photosystem II stability/assembly factor-like uncharacterized protein
MLGGAAALEMSTNPVEASGARRRRAVALAALALIAIAVAGVLYLRPAPTSKPQVPAPAVSLSQVSSTPLSFAFVTPQMGWASTVVAGQTMVFRTTDGAKHWERQLVGQSNPELTPGSYAPISIQLFGRTQGFMTAGQPVQQFYRTSDGGTTWARLPLPSLSVETIEFSDASYGWLSGSFTSTAGTLLSLFATQDAGDIWVRLPDPPSGAAGLAFRRPTEAWLGSYGPGPPHVFSSSASGQSWVRRDLPPPAGGSWTPDPFYSSFPTTIQLLPRSGAIARVEAIKCVVATAPPATCLNANAETFLFTSDGVSDTWRSVPFPPGPVAYQDAIHWWATGKNTLFKSTNAGQSWNPVATIPADWQFSAPGVLDSAHGWASMFVRGGYGLALTTDGGLHWNLANVPSAPVSS